MAISGYQVEINHFKNTFNKFKNKKIALYGIGRYTALLVPELKEYHIVGLLDKDPSNIGKLIYGLPVLSKETAEAKADLIIINTVSVYWETIFKRIYDVKIPIFYRNGERAVRKTNESYAELEYWKYTFEGLKAKIQEYDVVSFDIFDTLIMRKVFSPKDVFQIIERKIGKKLHLDIGFVELRNKASAHFAGEEVLLDEIYKEFTQISKLPSDVVASIKQLEIDTETELILPREEILSLYKEAIRLGKQVYLLSDMYIPSKDIILILQKYGIDLDETQVWISGEIKASKSSGDLWKLYKNTVIKDRRALHIGDNLDADVTKPKMYGLDAWYVMSASDMLKSSSMSDIVPQVCSLYDSVTMGLIIAKIFNSPFALNASKGKVHFENIKEFGYCIYGTVIASFLMWLYNQAKDMGIRQIVFFARDGYFMIQDYEYMAQLLKIKRYPMADYLLISRRVIALASIINKEDLLEVVGFPYTGNFGEYMEDRFGVTVDKEDSHCNVLVNASSDIEKIYEWMTPYMKSVKEVIQKTRDNYLHYLESIGFEEQFAIVDTWYYGNNQYFLSKLLNKRLIGFYFASNQMPDNNCCINNIHIPCFQAYDSKDAKECKLFQRSLITESFLTAPHGMITSVSSDGKYICEPKKENQKHFALKELMNEGVKNFIEDILKVLFLKEEDFATVNPLFSDKLFGEWFEGGCLLSADIKECFWSDNGMVQRREFKIFE